MSVGRPAGGDGAVLAHALHSNQHTPQDLSLSYLCFCLSLIFSLSLCFLLSLIPTLMPCPFSLSPALPPSLFLSLTHCFSLSLSLSLFLSLSLPGHEQSSCKLTAVHALIHWTLSSCLHSNTGHVQIYTGEKSIQAIQTECLLCYHSVALARMLSASSSEDA